MRKLIANLTENARLFAETRKLLGSSGNVLEVVEDEQEQAPEVAAEFYPPSVNGPSATEPTETASPTETTPSSAPSNSPGETKLPHASPEGIPYFHFDYRRHLPSDFQYLHLVLRRKVDLDPVAELLTGAGAQYLPGHDGTKVERSIGKGRQFYGNLRRDAIRS